MFKKSKNKNLTPPAPPTFEEILSDLETFHVDAHTQHDDEIASKIPDSSTNPIPLEAWWQMFEKFVDNLERLETMRNEVEGYQLKLESQKLEIETEATILKKKIKEQENRLKDLVVE